MGGVMTEQSQDAATAVQERRSRSDRRSHKHDELFTYAVSAGYFLELRKGERRNNAAPVEA